MIWVSWRQSRSQAIACLGVLAALAIYAIVVSTSMRTAFSHDGLAACLARNGGTNCPDAIQAFTNKFGSAVNVAFWSVLLIFPGLLGVLIGAPLIARELEFGTWRLAWSQTVTRTRWLAVKLAIVTGGVIVFGAAITAVITWYRAPMDRLTGRRSIPAMVAAFVPWLAIRLVVEFVLRRHFEAPLTFVQHCASAQSCMGGYGLGFIPPVTRHIGDWVLGPGGGSGNQSGNSYLYQPADRFWAFQSIEAGIFVALTAIALGAAIWILHRRPAA